MASPRLHPRRSSPSPLPRNFNTLPALVTAAAAPPPPLAKGATFHSPTSPSTERDPILHVPSLPQRSATSLQELEDIVGAEPSERIRRVLGAVDRSLSNLQSFAQDETIFGTDEAPVSAFMVTQQTAADADRMDVDVPHPASAPTTPHVRVQHKHHSSDSGIGSTVSSEAPSKQALSRPAGRVHTGINGATGPATAHHVLGEYACRQIQKHIILPIVREEKLKNFHPLVNGLPYRIARKEITCLRDLEKVLLWLAPVRQYAAQLAATRSRMAADERVELIGGLGRTGRPAELVHTKDGHSVSLRTGDEVTEDAKQHLKRSSMEIEEELERSMARRRKNAPLEKQIQKCQECDKVFKRPCDLTKHEKTHSRPWKCPEANCKYHDYGWPTEKERDRHVNDKHSAAPILFKCQYHPCPYESKRESNCKQHMEKAHGWTYVKSKSNGKVPTAKPHTPGRTPPTPLDSGASDFTMSPSPQVVPAGYGTPFSHPRHPSTDPSIQGGSSSLVSPELDFRRIFGTGEPVFGWFEGSNDLTDDLFSTTNLDSSRSWNDFTTPSTDLSPPGFQDTFNEDEPIFGQNFDWSNMNQDMTSLNMQLATPPLSLEPLPLDILKGVPNAPATLSPHEQAMLYSPYSMNSNEPPMDEGYCGEYPQELVRKPLADFSLFDAHTVSSLNTATKDAMFDDLSNFGNYVPPRENYAGVDYLHMRE